MAGDDGIVDLDTARYRRDAERRSGLRVEQLIALALEAEARGATPRQVRAILDGDLSEVADGRQR